MHCATIHGERWTECYNASDVIDVIIALLSMVKLPCTCFYLVQEGPHAKITSLVLTDGGAIV